jgi:hypothetical protein
MSTRISVACTLGTEADLFHVAKTVTGLCELESQNLIELTLRLSRNLGQAAVMLEIDGATGGIDLSDHSDKMQSELSNCDVYFKRCVRPEDLQTSHSLRPFGLNYACRSLKATRRLLTLFGPTDLVRRRSTWKKFLLVPLVKRFERQPTEPASRTILFQARLWDSVDCPGDEEINDGRVSLLLALRKQFGNRIVGGLVPTPYAQKHHPGLLTTLPSRQSQYVKWARKHMISIGFRGLFGSLGFKLGEALAASQCLIIEPTVAYLPLNMPLTKYHSADECIAACDHYLSHPDNAKRRQELAWEYYLSAVEPATHMKELLNSMNVINRHR